VRTYTVRAFAKTQAGSKIKLTRKGVTLADVDSVKKSFREILFGCGEMLVGVTYEVSSFGAVE
jgi:hypothetical protein